MRQITSPMFLYKYFFYRLIYLAAFTMVLISSGCKKEPVATTSNTPRPLPPPPPANPYTQPLVVVLNNDYIAWPADSSILKGYVSLNNQNISYLWRKVSGPAGYNIHDPNKLETKVDKLEAGEYEFEITATDVYGAKGSATLFVYVIKQGANEVIFKNIRWSCPMGCSIAIKNIYSFVPQNKPLSVFVRPANSSISWLPVIPLVQWNGSNVVVYNIDTTTNIFDMYVNDSNEKVDVKITY